MPPRIVAKTLRSAIRNTSKAPPAIAKEAMAQAFGAKPLGFSLGPDTAPLSLWQVREELAARLRSSGGRPALVDTTRRVKIPISEADWSNVVSITRQLDGKRFSASPAQVASVLLHLALDRFTEAEVRNALNEDD